MRALSDYIHNVSLCPGVDAAFHSHMASCNSSAGLRFGVYTDRGNLTCAGRPAAEGYEQLDAQTYANDWKVDYLKEDSCDAPRGAASHGLAFQQYGKVRCRGASTGTHDCCSHTLPISHSNLSLSVITA
eukprot:SAG11_NODE_2116_length_3792_cov_5.166802_6_plen_129_part_00